MAPLQVCCCLLLSLSCCTGAVLQRPPFSKVQGFPTPNHESQLATSAPGQSTLELLIVTSSELPKQIPAPPEPPIHSSTPQYHEDQPNPELTQFKLLWITPEMEGNTDANKYTSTGVPTQRSEYVIPKSLVLKDIVQRTDLLPNMV